MLHKISLAQSNVTVGDIAGNSEAILKAYRRGVAEKAGLVVFSELCVTAYPPEDLLLRPAFVQKAMDAVKKLALATNAETAMIIGGIWEANQKLYNAVFLLAEGKMQHIQYKHSLPNYGVFDEQRYFHAGALPKPVIWQGVKLGLLVCEDLWNPPATENLASQGAELLIAINASPYEQNKQAMRYEAAKARVRESGLPLVYVNQVGGQDELVFDGRSFVMNAKAEVVLELKGFAEEEKIIDLSETLASPAIASVADTVKDDYEACILGLRDYVRKSGFRKVLLGLSGGVDSALVAAIAVDALGAEQVQAVMLPSPYTSPESLSDATHCANLLGIRLETIPILPAITAFESMLAPVFAGKAKDVTEENIQSRIRGNLLMAMSNKFGALLLTTGNKSEMAVGYATLYGDMCGAYNPLKDLYKTRVYQLCAYRNSLGLVIPETIITKAPSAELRPDQKDQDSLPPYEILDAILFRTFEQLLSPEAIIAEGFEVATVEKVARLVKMAEYKRRQSPPGVKLTRRSLGKDWRYPLAGK